MQTTIAVALSYLLGSIPTSDIIARMRGVDLRASGSGNPGFTNALRVLGPRFATPVLIVDVAKGVLAVLVMADILGSGSQLGPSGIRLAAGVAAVAGHIWPVFTRFRGGKGVATACGVFLAMAPLATSFVVLLWVAIVATTRYVSMGSIAAAVALPFALWLEAGLRDTPPRTSLVTAGALVAVAVVLRHRANIRRLVKGTENRFGKPRGEGGNR